MLTPTKKQDIKEYPYPHIVVQCIVVLYISAVSPILLYILDNRESIESFYLFQQLQDIRSPPCI